MELGERGREREREGPLLSLALKRDGHQARSVEGIGGVHRELLEGAHSVARYSGETGANITTAQTLG